MTFPGRVYGLEDLVVDVDGNFPADYRVFDRRPRDPRPMLIVRAVGYGEAERVAKLLQRRFRLGPAWPMREPLFVVVDNDARPGSVGVSMMTQIRDRSSGEPRDITFAGPIPIHRDDDFMIEKFADQLEAFVMHEVRESMFVDGALLRDPHRLEFTLTVQLPVRAEEEK